MNPPLRNPSDAAKYREQYLSNLALEASNNQKNYNANAILKTTGQTPTQPPDMRSLEDKLQDIEGQKVMLRSQLSQLTDGFIAQGIVSSITPEEILFAVQHFPYIVSVLKPRYALGVPKAVFIDFLRKIMKQMDTTLGVELGLQQATGENILLSLKNIENVLTNKTQLDQLKAEVERLPDSPLKSAVLNRIVSLRDSLLTPDEINKLNEIDPIEREQFLQMINEYMSNYPTRENIDNELRNIDRYKQQGQITSVEAGSILDSVTNTIPITNYDKEKTERLKELLGTPPSKKPEISGIAILYSETQLNEIETYVTELLSEFDNAIVNRDQSKKEALINQLKKTFKQYDIKYTFSVKSKPAAILKKFRQWLNNQKLINSKRSYGEGFKMKGKGVSVKKPVQRMQGEYVKPKAYVQLGRYLLNIQRLKECILMIKTPSGLAIPELPTEKITEDLSVIINDIREGRTLNIDKLNSLSDDDKKKLKLIVKKCQLDISVPNPDLTKEQQENRRFEVLRGEIIAGNDSEKIAKELKTLIVKFVHDGRLPRRQAHEILLDLSAMGY